jgi:hypothetical protein
MLLRVLTRQLRRVMLPEFQKTWNRDIDARLKGLQQALGSLQQELARLTKANRRLELLREWDEVHAATLARLQDRLAIDRIAAHIQAAIERADVVADPAPHIVVEQMLPLDIYELLLQSIPPSEFFSDRDPVKQDFELRDLPRAPRFSRAVWSFFDQQVVAQVLSPAVFERLRPAVVERYCSMLGSSVGVRAATLIHQTRSGRIMLRRPGYQLKPHLDPKRVVLTGIMYLARPTDSEEYGTQLFRVTQPFVQPCLKTFFPEDAGLRCELARTVPFRPNSLLAFVNAEGAHGAILPRDARLLERYAYQFYIKPGEDEFVDLLRHLPPDVRAQWEEMLGQPDQLREAGDRLPATPAFAD